MSVHFGATDHILHRFSDALRHTVGHDGRRFRFKGNTLRVIQAISLKGRAKSVVCSLLSMEPSKKRTGQSELLHEVFPPGTRKVDAVFENDADGGVYAGVCHRSAFRESQEDNAQTLLGTISSRPSPSHPLPLTDGICGWQGVPDFTEETHDKNWRLKNYKPDGETSSLEEA